MIPEYSKLISDPESCPRRSYTYLMLCALIGHTNSRQKSPPLSITGWKLSTATGSGFSLLGRPPINPFGLCCDSTAYKMLCRQERQSTATHDTTVSYTYGVLHSRSSAGDARQMISAEFAATCYCKRERSQAPRRLVAFALVGCWRGHRSL